MFWDEAGRVLWGRVEFQSMSLEETGWGVGTLIFCWLMVNVPPKGMHDLCGVLKQNSTKLDSIAEAKEIAVLETVQGGGIKNICQIICLLSDSTQSRGPLITETPQESTF